MTYKLFYQGDIDLNNVLKLFNECNDESSFYLLKMEIGIPKKLTIINKNSIFDMNHQCVEFKIDDKIWVADATYGDYNDLSRIHYGDETIGFGWSHLNFGGTVSDYRRNYAYLGNDIKNFLLYH